MNLSTMKQNKKYYKNITITYSMRVIKRKIFDFDLKYQEICYVMDYRSWHKSSEKWINSCWQILFWVYIINTKSSCWDDSFFIKVNRSIWKVAITVNNFRILFFKVFFFCIVAIPNVSHDQEGEHTTGVVGTQFESYQQLCVILSFPQ